MADRPLPANVLREIDAAVRVAYICGDTLGREQYRAALLKLTEAAYVAGQEARKQPIAAAGEAERPVSPGDLSVGGDDGSRQRHQPEQQAAGDTQAPDARGGTAEAVPEMQAAERSQAPSTRPVDSGTYLPLVRGIVSGEAERLAAYLTDNPPATIATDSVVYRDVQRALTQSAREIRRLEQALAQKDATLTRVQALIPQWLVQADTSEVYGGPSRRECALALEAALHPNASPTTPEP